MNFNYLVELDIPKPAAMASFNLTEEEIAESLRNVFLQFVTQYIQHNAVSVLTIPFNKQ